MGGNISFSKKGLHFMELAVGAYVILMGNPEGKRPLSKPRRRWEVTLASQKKKRTSWS
jgi:hypothetical protein